MLLAFQSGVSGKAVVDLGPEIIEGLLRKLAINDAELSHRSLLIGRTESDLAALRIAYARERELRQSLEKQRDRLAELLHAAVARFDETNARLDGVIEMMGAKP